jgi:uncharacterized protein with HEPN domain
MAGHTRHAFHLNQAKTFALQAIEGRRKAGATWQDDPVIAAGITHLAETAAEHMGNIPRDVQVKYPDVPWQAMADFRNIAAHSYHRVSFGIVESVVRDDLPRLIPQIDQMLGDGV